MMKVMEFNIQGGIPSPHDPRDFKPSDLGTGAPTPEKYSPDIANIPVYMQDQQPACGGHAGTTLYGILAALGTNLSPRFVYALCKKIDGIPDQQGTTGRAIMQVLQKYGVCTNDLFPNDTSLPYAQYADWALIPNAAYVDALSRRIGAYAKLPTTDFQSVKDAIYQNKAVLILGQVGATWWTPSWSATDILPLKAPNPVVGGHFWVDFGFDILPTDFRNSWSDKWGDNGNGWYDENYSPFIVEAWTAQLPLPVVPPVPANVAPTQQNLVILQRLVSLYQQLLSLIKGRNSNT